MIRKISHIGIAVKDLNSAIEMYRKLGLEVEGTEIVESQNVRVAFIPVGDVRIELLEATMEDSTIAKFIEKKGEGIHHIALNTDDLESDLQSAETQGITLIDSKPRKGAHQTKIAFLHPKSTNGVLLELCQDKG
ncbi:MAG: methylmalonyl-CoA epimerase [Candidatus Cloacimonetes bacterium]|nr:methylmalonyl-CoA epimerase [Candidatus Cloacimonadota bacterium]